MSLTVKDNGKTFLPAPQGLHIARCYAVIDLGVQFNYRFNHYSAKVLIGWELPAALMPSGKPFIQYQRYTASLAGKAHLRQLLESWRGRCFTSEELEGFHLKNILGVPCYLNITQTINPKSQQIYSQVVAACPLPDGTICPEPFNSLLYFDLDDYSDDAYNSIPESIRQKINLNRGNVRADASTEVVSASANASADVAL
jgi:hypothetical protein